MRTITKVATLGLAVAGIQWWLAARRRRQLGMDDVTTGIYRTASVGATAGLEDDAYDDVADAVARGDVEIVGDVELIAIQPSTEELEDGYVGVEAGESWLEAVEQDAVENGPAAEREIVIVAEADEPLHPHR